MRETEDFDTHYPPFVVGISGETAFPDIPRSHHEKKQAGRRPKDRVTDGNENGEQ